LGILVRSVEDIEYGHELLCEVGRKTYSVLVGYDWIAKGWWEVSYSPRFSLLQQLQRLCGQSEEEERRTLTRALSTALSSLPALGEVRWYKSYGSPGRHHSPMPEE
jgi:hypothetical protein